MKFFASVPESDSSKYQPDKYPYPYKESVENQPDIHWHIYKFFGIRYQVWNKHTIKNNTVDDSEKKPFQSDDGKFKRVIISHGFGEHLLLYNRFAYELINKFKDIEVCVFEYRGSGLCLPVDDLIEEYNLKTADEIENLKYLHPLSNKKLFKAANMKGETNRFIQLDQLSEFVSFFKQGKGVGQTDISLIDNETILFGHSLGGQLATEYVFKHFPNNLANKTTTTANYYIDGLILCGPLYYLAPETRPPSALLTVSKLLSKVIPNVKVDSELSVKEIVNDVKVQEFMLNDFPYLAPCIGSILLFYEMISTGENMALDKFYNSLTDEQYFPKKIKFVHGKEDGVNDYRGTQKVHAILGKKFKANAVDLDLLLVENGKHSLFLCDEQVFSDFFSFISSV